MVAQIAQHSVTMDALHAPIRVQVVAVVDVLLHVRGDVKELVQLHVV